MNIELAGRNALVCGASKGIGRAIALELAKAGANVTVLARSEQPLQELVGTLDQSQGQKHSYLAVDIGGDKLKGAVEKAVENSGGIHILVNNTAGPAGGQLSEADPKNLTKAFTEHILASHQITQVVVPFMKSENFGRVINIISTSVKQPIPGLGVSNTIRGAMASWSKTLATELGPHGITVNNVLPGATETDRLTQIIDKQASAGEKSIDAIRLGMLKEIPAGRFAAPEEIAFAAVFLASEFASYINGTSILVDGGRTRALS